MRLETKLFVAVAAWSLSTVSLSHGQDWHAKYPELVYMIIPDTDAKAEAAKFQPMLDYLTRSIGVATRLEQARSCEDTMEGQRAGRIHIASYCGAATFARSYLTGVKAEPFAMDINADGTKGYQSVFFVKKNSPYQSIRDLKGKILGLGMPDSTSGDLEPRFILNQFGITPEEFFRRVVYTGSHEDNIAALRDGKVDVAAAADDAPTRFPKSLASQFRSVYSSEILPNPPLVYLSDMPGDLKSAIRKAFLEIGQRDMAAFNSRAGSNQSAKPWIAADLQVYQHTIDMMKFIDRVRSGKL
jgi:phosphonate transport system substrate-binding protein